MRWCWLVIWLCLGGVALGQAEPEVPVPLAKESTEAARATAVIYNENDPLSVDLANYYAMKRHIPAENLVGLKCSGNEEITRTEYEETIGRPLRAEFRKRKWWVLDGEPGLQRVMATAIRFVAVIRGVPLKVAPIPDYAPDNIGEMPAELRGKNEASVDSELAILSPQPTPLSGAIGNPYFRSYSPILEAGMPQIMLVCRLDGPNVDVVQRMIDDALYAEVHGLWGWCYADIRGLKSGAYVVGDDEIKKAATDAQHNGMPVILDAGETLFPPGYPMRRVALYYGWYAEQVSGPFAAKEPLFEKGAIAVHIHSFSASTVRATDKNWVGPLLTRGAAATCGAVYEPYYGLLTSVEVFHDRLRRGFTLAESAYAGQRGLSWMNVVLGDPLYRPFKLINEPDATLPDGEWTDYATGAKKWFSGGDRQAVTAELKAAGNKDGSGTIFEGLALLQAAARDLPSCYASLARARKLYQNKEDIARCYLHEVNLLRFTGKKKESLALVRTAIRECAETNAVDVLRSVELELDPPPPPPPATSGTSTSGTSAQPHDPR